ncbi:CST complex subunit STN1 [Labeo rohita]|uniref:CST complex subunit STN1 n=1 Tax=Labeo rohita TaxID=84645 RepID=A0ABQ8MZG5_LABRO|nr:CST complex subunit STN1 [Labeo rohita]
MAVSPGDADADELPSMLWGLDPVFSAYSKLYITDILQMKESRQVPGVYFYKSHPLYQVDVLGTVVYKRERDDFYCYGDELKRLKEAERKSTVLEIGDLLRVRGTIKTSRDAREIRANCFFLALKEFLVEKEVARFRPYDVEFLLHPLIQNSSAEKESDQPRTSFATQIRKLLKETLSILQNEGQIFRKMRTADEVYNVTEQDKDLHTAIKDVLREDTKREKYAEKGCHVLHILSSVRQRYSQNLSREVLEVALTFLECNSDIISTTEAHYIVL